MRPHEHGSPGQGSREQGSTDQPRSLGRWAERPQQPSDLDRQWLAIRERRARGRSRIGAWALFGLLVAGAGAIALAYLGGGSAPSTSPALVGTSPGAVLESGAEPRAMTIADGSQIELAASTRLVAEDGPGRDVRFAISRGRATFDVARDPTRTFSIDAGDVLVVVVGTRFSVEHTGDRVEVTVERGRVDVHTSDAVHQLAAGETWSGEDEAHPVEGTALLEPESQVEVEVPHRPRGSDAPSPSELFEQAREARREGRDAESATAYDQLMRRYPRDSHVGLAAFELARIRMDALHDIQGAIAPLERAIAARTFREDAMARLVTAYDATGQRARCRTARERYVEAYPEGLHRGAVEARCAE